MAKKRRGNGAPGQGHNNVTGERLRSFVSRIEQLEEDRAETAADIKEVYAELKGEGFDTKIVRKIVARRKRDEQEVSEEEELMDLYLSALGDLPLFEAEHDAPGGEEQAHGKAEGVFQKA